jgi:cation:H+ antiporter
MIIQNILLVVAGIACLYFGGDYLVSGASRLARSLGIPVAIIGLTIVAFGTSVPELVTNLVAISRGTNDIGIGNIVGSNIANIGLILGLSGAIATRALITRTVLKDYSLMMGATVFTFALILDGRLDRLDGILLLIGIIAYVLWSIYQARHDHQQTPEEKESQEHPEEHKVLRNSLLLLGGLVILTIGAQLTVDNAVALARVFGISELVIGVTVVAVGTSLPELATSVIAATKNQHEIALGNVIGSNIFNLLGILGVAGTLSPFAVNANILRFDGLVMLAISGLLGLLMFRGRDINRAEGRLLLLVYGAYILALIIITLTSGAPPAILGEG